MGWDDMKIFVSQAASYSCILGNGLTYSKLVTLLNSDFKLFLYHEISTMWMVSQHIEFLQIILEI